MNNKKTVLTGRYELGKLLGKGTYGEVYLAKSLTIEKTVAIKILDKDRLHSPRHEKQVLREISSMRLIKHPNVLELYEVMASENKIYLVLEYAKGGELADKMVQGKLQEDVARRYFQQLINAIDYCHSRGVYHRDLKPRNLLLDENGILKISDFGLSAIVDYKNKNVMLYTPCGSRPYTAPEVILKQPYNGAKADIWSCGVILFSLVAGYNPFQDDNLLQMFNRIVNNDYRFPNRFPFEVQKLVKMMLNLNPSLRYPVAKIREFPWFRKGLEEKTFMHSVERQEPVTGETLEGEWDQQLINIKHFNAFDIISLSVCSHLSKLFEDNDLKKEVMFTAIQPASEILSQLENMAKILKLKVRNKAGVLEMEASREGRKGPLAINFEILQITASLHMVDIEKSSGDTMEYQNLVEEEIRPALKDIIWVWQGDQQEQQQQERNESLD